MSVRRPLLPFFLALALVGHVLPANAANPVLAVMAFDYVDTSGEAVDQTADHARRMELFRTVLQRDLNSSDAVDAVELPCTAEGCTPANSRPIDLLESARSVGARYIVLGAVQKMSTLISSGWVNIIDVTTGNVATARKLSFRGDTDEAFLRAAGFAADDILRNLPEAASADAR